MTNFDLRLVPAIFLQSATASEREDVSWLMMTMSNEHHMSFVFANGIALRERGSFEKTLLDAWQSTRTNNRTLDPAFMASLFRNCDRKKLMNCGDKLPGKSPYRVFRGIAGHGTHRRPAGLSWSGSQDVACWFAIRYGLKNPHLLTAEVAEEEVFAYIKGRNEQEFVVLPSSWERVILTMDEMRASAARKKA